MDGLDVGAAVSGQIEIVDEDDLARSLTIQEGVLPSALAPILPVLFLPNGRLLGALQSLVAGVYKGPFAGLQTFFAVSHDSAAGRLVPGGRPHLPALAQRPRTSPFISVWTPRWKPWSSAPAAAT